jgi:hypothetical protein
LKPSGVPPVWRVWKRCDQRKSHINGFELFKELRKKSDVPVMVDGKIIGVCTVSKPWKSINTFIDTTRRNIFGAGIPDYATDKVFDKFYSLQRPGSGKKSSGLGLPDGTVAMPRLPMGVLK